MAVDAVVSSAMSGIMRGALIALLIVIVLATLGWITDYFEHQNDRQYAPTTRQAAGYNH